jgi:proline dehydrogenase
MRRLLLWASENAWLRDRLPRHAFVRRAVSRFMPGETLEEALSAATLLAGERLATILTLLGENVRDRADADIVVRHYLDALLQIRARGLAAEISIKLTHLGLDLDPAVAERGLVTLAEASPADRILWVDMEGSAYTERTLDVFGRVHAAHANVGLCLQAYLRRTATDLERLTADGAAIRLVKGAYAEPATVAFPRKADVDARFLALACRMLESRTARAAIATHDTRLIEAVRRAASERGRGPDAYEFQMLYGIQRDEQRRLAAAGHRVRVLVSYGSAWFPWYMRRLAERPANLWFVLRNLAGA